MTFWVAGNSSFRPITDGRQLWCVSPCSMCVCMRVCEVHWWYDTKVISLLSHPFACCFSWSPFYRAATRDGRTYWPLIGCPASRWACPWTPTPPCSCVSLHHRLQQQDVKHVVITWARSSFNVLVGSFDFWFLSSAKFTCYFLEGSN